MIGILIPIVALFVVAFGIVKVATKHGIKFFHR